MRELSTADLVLLHLLTCRAEGGPGPVGERSVAGIADALGVGDTVADRVDMLTALTDLTERELVTRETGGDAMETRAGPYRLTSRGRRRADGLRADLAEETVTVESAAGTRDVPVRELPSRLPELTLVEALRKTTDGLLRLAEGEATDLVGREAATETVEAGLADVRDGTARTLLISGEAGIGKTALVDDLLRRAADRGFRTLEGTAGAGSDEPFGPVRAALADHSDVMPDRLFETTTVGEAANLEDRRRSVFYYVAQGLGELAADRPVALALTDLERADPATLALFEYLGGGLGDVPVLVVGALTPERVADDHPLAPGADLHPKITRVDLEAFDREDTARFLEGVLGDTEIPSAFVEALHEHTGGNPLFLEESVTYMADGGAIDPRAGYYPAEPATLPVPEGIQATIRQRVDALDPGTRRVLEWASVAGEPVSRDVLAAVDDIDAEALGARLRRLASAGVVRETGDGAGRFKSEVVREVVRDGIDPGEAARMHRAVAEALQTVHADAPDAHASRIAAQYRAAGAVGDAIDWYERAGAHAAGQYASETAIEEYEAALELARNDDRDERVLDLLEALGRLHRLAEAFDEAERYLEYVAERASDRARRRRVAIERARLATTRDEFAVTREVLDPVLADWDGETPSRPIARALVLKAKAACHEGEADETGRLLERAESLAEALDDPGLRATVDSVAGLWATMYDVDDDAADRYERAADLYEAADDPRGVAHASNGLAAYYEHRGDLDRAKALFRRSYEGYRAVENNADAVLPLANLALDLAHEGRFEEAGEHLAEALALARDLGLERYQSICLSFFGSRYLLWGDVTRAVAFTEWTLARCESGSAGAVETARTHAHLATILPLADDLAGALEHAERARELADPSSIFLICDARLAEATVHRELGDPDRAVDIHEEMLERAPDTASWRTRVDHLTALSHAHRAAGNAGDALDAAERAVAETTESGFAILHLGAQVALGRARHAVGETAAATDLLREVLADAEALGADTVACEATLALGTVLADRGATDEARARLQEVLDLGETTGAELYARTARERLATLD